MFTNNPTRARNTDPETSHAAVTPHRLAESQWAVLEHLEGGPMTDHELIDFHDWHTTMFIRWPRFTDQRIRSARAELVEMGLVEFSGEYRETPSGRRAKVWQVRH